MIRKIIEINDEKCNGCGLCANACHEGAIEIVNGKARLISETYCDGLGNCLPACPTDAIRIVDRESAPFDEEAVKVHISKKNAPRSIGGGCPGSRSMNLREKESIECNKGFEKQTQCNSSQDIKKESATKSELGNWPVQLTLVNPDADYFNGADLLIAADCTAYACNGFHDKFIKDHVTVIGCPKLDDINSYTEKLTYILSTKDIQSVTVVRMQVPCCGGIVHAVREAVERAGSDIPVREYIVGMDGNVR